MSCVHASTAPVGKPCTRPADTKELTQESSHKRADTRELTQEGSHTEELTRTTVSLTQNSHTQLPQPIYFLTRPSIRAPSIRAHSIRAPSIRAPKGPKCPQKGKIGTVWCSVVQCGAVWCSVVQCGAVWCSVVQCGAVCCSVLQCVHNET